MKWHKTPSSALSSDAPIQLWKIGGTRFCLISYEGKWYATSAKCPHAGANLAAGWCENGLLVCPYHRHKFDLNHGKGAAGQNNSIRTYKLEHRDDGWYIELPQHIWNRWFGFFK